MCITADLAAVNTGRITLEIKGHSHSYRPSAPVGGAGGGRL